MDGKSEEEGDSERRGGPRGMKSLRLPSVQTYLFEKMAPWSVCVCVFVCNAGAAHARSAVCGCLLHLVKRLFPLPPPPPLHPAPASLWSAIAQVSVPRGTLVSLESPFHALSLHRDTSSLSLHLRSCVHSSAVKLCLLVYFFFFFLTVG